MSSNQLSDVLRRGTNKYNRVRQLARKQVKKSGKDMICVKCGYEKHVEISHVKAICEFDPSTPLDVVNDLSNLLILCPNCHWEHDNEEKQKLKNLRTICSCGRSKGHKSMKCVKCSNLMMKEWRHNNSKIPQKEILEKLIQEKPFTEIGKIYGVSGNSIKKWCNKYHIDAGNRLGFWAKTRSKSGGAGGTRTPDVSYVKDYESLPIAAKDTTPKVV